MSLAPFFDRVYGALGGHLSVSRESLLAVLDDVTVGIRCGDSLTSNDKWIAELSVNLIARLYPRIAISGSGVEVQRLQEVATSINPKIEFANRAANPTTISIGSSDAEQGALFPSATGWVAHLAHSSSDRVGPSNPYSSAAAAAMAAAELFRRIFLKTSDEPDLSLSLLNYDQESGADLELPRSDVGEVVFVGVGAVGNAALWVLARHKNLTGRVILVDPESLTLLNLQRYVLGTIADIGRSKVHLGHNALDGTRLVVEVSELTLESLAETLPDLRIPTIAISVDNVSGRRTAQALLPRLLVNGWTGEQALGVSWHSLPRDAACLACLYHPHGQGPSATEQAARALGLREERAALLWVTQEGLSEEDLQSAATALGIDVTTLDPWRGKPLAQLYTDVVCGAVPLDISGVGRVETVPLAHQSALVGVLMAAELIKRTDAKLAKMSQTEPLVSWENILKSPPTTWRRPRARERGCICNDQDYQQVYQSKWPARTSSLKRPRR